MQDATDVICAAAKGFTEQIAKRREISERRLYEILAKDNPYPKAKRLIRDIAALNPAGARLIKADLMALFDECLEPDPSEVSADELIKDLNDAELAKVSNAPKAIRLRKDREAIEVLCRDIAEIENESSGVAPVREDMRAAVEKRRNGHG
jgi:hypothetical protein